MKNRTINLLACPCLLIIMAVGCTQSQSVVSKVIKTETGIRMELADIDFSGGNQNENTGSAIDNRMQYPTNIVGENRLPFNQSFGITVPCGGSLGTWVFLLKDNELTNTPVLNVNGRTGGQRAMDLVTGVSTGAGIAAAGALIRPSRQSFTGGGNNNTATGGVGTGIGTGTGGQGGQGGKGGSGHGTAAINQPK